MALPAWAKIHRVRIIMKSRRPKILSSREANRHMPMRKGELRKHQQRKHARLSLTAQTLASIAPRSQVVLVPRDTFVEDPWFPFVINALNAKELYTRERFAFQHP